ncbi:MAG TPA: cupin domain-containing protein [Firmicutes bacterium]|nr:cupin domain-containing protein [Bacillota bacterium]
MVIVHTNEEKGVTIGAPFHRTIKVLLAPDKNDVKELTFSHVVLHARSQTDYHKHDRPELIFILSGAGVMKVEGKEYPIAPNYVYWVLKEEMHQMINTADNDMTFVTVFVPGYTAEENYKRCLDAAAAVAKAGAAGVTPKGGEA